jgi:hypothetical protein
VDFAFGGNLFVLASDDSAILRKQTVLGFLVFKYDGAWAASGIGMTEYTRRTLSPREHFLRTAEQELAKFERRENEFLKKERIDRAAELQIPVGQIEVRN